MKFSEIRTDTEVSKAVEYIREGNAMKDIFRPHSAAQYLLIREVRSLYEDGDIELHNTFDLHLIESDAGKFGLYEGNEVPLDMPIVEEEDKELNSPKRGGPKKYYVFVKNDKGNVVKVTFGDTSGLKAKIDDPEARKSFAARHKCDQQNDKTTAAYWACRLPYYAKELGLSGGGNFFW